MAGIGVCLCWFVHVGTLVGFSWFFGFILTCLLVCCFVVSSWSCGVLSITPGLCAGVLQLCFLGGCVVGLLVGVGRSAGLVWGV